MDTRPLCICLLLALGLGACSTQRVSHPVDAVDAYCRAVEREDADAVYAMLDEEARMGMDREAFEAWFARHHESILEQAQELKAQARAEAFEVEAAVPVRGGQEARVGWFDGGWYLTQEVPARSAQSTPRETLEALQQAIEEEDLEELLRLLSADLRGQYLRELQALGSRTRDSQDKAIVAHGDQADILLDNGDRILLVREEGVWKISGYETTRQ